jgi:hypothetical protein
MKNKASKPKAKNKAKSGNLFKTAVENTPDIANCYQSGLHALGKYSKKIERFSHSQNVFPISFGYSKRDKTDC